MALFYSEMEPAFNNGTLEQMVTHRVLLHYVFDTFVNKNSKSMQLYRSVLYKSISPLELEMLLTEGK